MAFSLFCVVHALELSRGGVVPSQSDGRTGRFLCGGSDVCEAPAQFCLGDTINGVCRNCRDYIGRCFQQDHIANCTKVCRDHFLLSTSTSTARPEVSTSIGTTDLTTLANPNDGLPVPIIVVIVAASVILTGVILLIRIGRRRNWFNRCCTPNDQDAPRVRYGHTNGQNNGYTFVEQNEQNGNANGQLIVRNGTRAAQQNGIPQGHSNGAPGRQPNGQIPRSGHNHVHDNVTIPQSGPIGRQVIPPASDDIISLQDTPSASLSVSVSNKNLPNCDARGQGESRPSNREDTIQQQRIIIVDHGRKNIQNSMPIQETTNSGDVLQDENDLNVSGTERDAMLSGRTGRGQSQGNTQPIGNAVSAHYIDLGHQGSLVRRELEDSLVSGEIEQHGGFPGIVEQTDEGYNTEHQTNN